MKQLVDVDLLIYKANVTIPEVSMVMPETKRIFISTGYKEVFVYPIPWEYPTV